MKLLLADDHAIVRDGLRWMLSGEPDIDIVGEASDGQQVLDALRAADGAVDVVLLDIRMPVLGGLDALRLLRRTDGAALTPAFIVLSMHQEPAVVLRAIELGAAGYLLKSSTREQLLAALRHVAAGNCDGQAEVTGPLLDHVAMRDDIPSLPALTDRELEVLGLVATGQGNKQIAARLSLTEATLKTHLKAIFSRLGVTNRTEAVTAALRLRLIQDA